MIYLIINFKIFVRRNGGQAEAECVVMQGNLSICLRMAKLEVNKSALTIENSIKSGRILKVSKCDAGS